MNRRGFLAGVFATLGAACVELPTVSEDMGLESMSAILKELYPMERIKHVLYDQNPFFGTLHKRIEEEEPNI